MNGRRAQSVLRLLTASLWFLPLAAPAWGAVVLAPTYAGGNGAISFGVAPYGGAPVVTGPTYINNNFDNRADILASPGLGSLNGYLTASPVVANNIASIGPLPLPLGLFLVGGGNGNGPFGSGLIVNFGTLTGFAMSDSSPGGGSASYGISSANADFTIGAVPIPVGTSYGAFLTTSYGAFLTMGGLVPLAGNADVASLRVHIFDANAASPFNNNGNGVDLPQMVLAISNNGVAGYNIVQIGGAGGGNAKVLVDNAANGAFRALSVDNLLLPAALPAGDTFTVTSTLTLYADPASFSSFDPTFSTDLLALTGPLPLDTFVGTTSIPEPTSLVMFGTGVACLMGCLRRQLRKLRKAAKAAG